MKNYKTLFLNEEGQGMLEYGLIIALVSIAVLAVGLLKLHPNITALFGKVNEEVGNIVV